MTGYIGKIESFDDSTETWSSRENLLGNLTLPDKPATKSYDDIVKLLKDHLSSKPLIVAERFRFYKRYQIQGETANRYVTELRKFAEYCEFGNLNESLIDHCNKKGHSRKACRSSGKPKQRPAQKNVNSLDNQSREYISDQDDYLGIYSVNNSNQDSIWITPNVNGKEVKMELDTGSAVSVISALDYEKYFQNEKLENGNVTLKTYSGELLIPTGYMNVQVKYNGQWKNLKLYVVQKCGPALFGRDWLRKINLDWKNLKWINKISVSRNSNEKLDLLLKEYSNVFREGIGCVADIKAHLTLKENASPKFVKARPVPFSVKPQVERELIRFQNHRESYA
ncbi:unnamed protein product [Mytilus coruscus]|uniref:Peptidase A2 domain-containing protein n=1 Tax=Mytilus coruscus TaxID=42192 RepID=A0A6J8CIQ6_MYTCO|nr:unnamed protein product [Mytilus coruscus]